MSRGQQRVLRDLARGGEIAFDGSSILLVRGDHLRGIRWSTYAILSTLHLIEQGRITDLGLLVYALGGMR